VHRKTEHDSLTNDFSSTTPSGHGRAKDAPQSIAIAGAWGYIGSKFLNGAIALGMDVRVFDPGERPGEMPSEGYTQIEDEEAFYRQEADLFHLAVHPEHRRRGLEILLDRARAEPVFILNEKPMAAPESPEIGGQIVERMKHSSAVMLYDYPELFDAMTAQIVQTLRQFQHVEITHLSVCRSKDREAPENPRNYKRMVPIQYQESVHCLAFVLYLLESVGGQGNLLDQGIALRAESAPYRPPNPEIYPHVVDGRCDYSMQIGEVQVDGTTDFTSGAPWSKRRIIRGIGDGQNFTIEVDYLEGKKRLSINGVDQACDPMADSYQQAIVTAWEWCKAIARSRTSRTEQAVYPDAQFAQETYQLSSALWHSSQTGEPIGFDSRAALVAFDAQFAEVVKLGPMR